MLPEILSVLVVLDRVSEGDCVRVMAEPNEFRRQFSDFIMSFRREKFPRSTEPDVLNSSTTS